jgi:pimeloyl-ACP methyl ester carboxylesterase
MVSGCSAVKTLRANSVRLAYRECGDPADPPVVLLHGSASESATWNRFVPRLTATGYRSIALDLRGHAASARTADYALSSLRDDLLDLITVLGLDDVTLIGHSVGGYAALAATLHAPERIARLVLEDLAAPPRRTALPTVRNLFGALASSTGALARDRSFEYRTVASIIRQLSRPDPAWWAQLGEVRTPTLILSGGPNSCISPQRLAEVAAALPAARLATIPVGHRVHSLAPDSFTAEVLAFLAEGVETSRRGTGALTSPI